MRLLRSSRCGGLPRNGDKSNLLQYMKFSFSKLQARWVVPFVGIILTIALYAIPYVALPIDLGAGYHGIFMHKTADSDPYLARIEEARAGHPFAIEVFVGEYKYAPLSRMPKIGETALGVMARVVSMRAPLFVAVTTPIFAAVIFFLWYLMGLRATQRRLGAFFLGLIAIGGVPLFQLFVQVNFGEIARTLVGRGSGAEFLLYTRPVNPNFSGIFWAAFLLLAFWCWERRTRASFILAGIFAGTLAYWYDPYWVYAMVLFGLLCVLVVVRDRAHRWHACGGLALSLVVAAPVMVDAVQSLGRAAVACYGSGVPVLSHTPIIEKITLATLALWFLGYRMLAKRFGRAYGFVLLGLIASLVVVNQQVITGRVAQPHHFYFFTNTPFTTFALGLIAVYLVERLRRPQTLFIAGSLVIALFALGSQIGSYRAARPEFSDLQRYGPAFAWLNANTKAGDVVLADPRMGDLIPAYTHNDSYLAGHAAVSCAVPQNRLEHNFFTLMRLEGVAPEGAGEYLRANRNQVGVLVFEGQYWREQCGSYGCFPDRVLDDLAQKYQALYDIPLASFLVRAPLQYVLIDRKRNPSWTAPTRSAPVWAGDQISIYAFAPNP